MALDCRLTLVLIQSEQFKSGVEPTDNYNIERTNDDKKFRDGRSSAAGVLNPAIPLRCGLRKPLLQDPKNLRDKS